MSLATFKNFSAERMDVDELVALSAFGKSLKAEYTAIGVETPEYVDVQLKSLRREVKGRVADKLEAERRRLQAQLENLKTTAEKKADVRKQLEAVTSQLADE